jgi:Tfp pilus assembly protein PilZ
MNIIKVRFRSQADFLKYYSSELPNGGLFSPTTTEFAAGDPVVIELTVTGLLPNKVMISGKVVWWRPSLPRLRVRAGALVEFDAEESSKRDFVLNIVVGEAAKPKKRRHARLPVSLPVRYRTAATPDFREAVLTEISIGGALLRTDEAIDLGTDVIIELQAPGASVAIPLAGKVTYRIELDGVGLKFIYRDGGGSRRIREVIRRIKVYG